jgi:hypothetical protein
LLWARVASAIVLCCLVLYSQPPICDGLLEAKVENVNLEWFLWSGDQGFVPANEGKRQVDTFGQILMPCYKEKKFKPRSSQS